jgi:hypothetical protein
MNALSALCIKLAAKLGAAIYASMRQVCQHLAQCGLAAIE